MDYFETYIKDGVILFDIALIDACENDSSGAYNVESNMPDEVLELALPNYFEKVHELNHLNKEEMYSFLKNFGEKVYQLDTFQNISSGQIILHQDLLILKNFIKH